MTTAVSQAARLLFALLSLGEAWAEFGTREGVVLPLADFTATPSARESSPAAAEQAAADAWTGCAVSFCASAVRGTSSTSVSRMPEMRMATVSVVLAKTCSGGLVRL